MTSKCYEEHYLDFLVYLAGFELGNLKIYNMLESLSRGEVEISDCYKQLANSYVILERSVGDPPQALRILSEAINYSELSKFLKDYGNVMVTSGDTKSFVEHSIKQEFARYRARVNELLKSLDVLYESYLVVVLVTLFFIVMPMTGLTPIFSLLIIYVLSLAGYLLAYRVCKKLYYTVPNFVIISDIAALTLIFMLGAIPGGAIYVFIPLALLHFITKKLVRRLDDLENESVHIVYDVYTQVLMGKFISSAIVATLGGSIEPTYRFLWLGLIHGLNPSEILRVLRLPRFSGKVMSLLLSSLPYSSLGEAHLAHVVMFVDEVQLVRKSVKEKARFYMFYSLLTIALILATYFMLTRAPSILTVDKHALAVYGSVSLLLVSGPALLIKDRGFTSSSMLIPILACSLCVYLGMHLLI